MYFISSYYKLLHYYRRINTQVLTT